MSDRKPPVAMESREPHSIRFTPTEWEAIVAEAAARGMEPAVFVRKLCLIALEDVMRYSRREASIGVPDLSVRASAGMLSGSRRTRRF